jgi:hypothetical protein
MAKPERARRVGLCEERRWEVWVVSVWSSRVRRERWVWNRAWGGRWVGFWGAIVAKRRTFGFKSWCSSAVDDEESL